MVLLGQFGQLFAQVFREAEAGGRGFQRAQRIQLVLRASHQRFHVVLDDGAPFPFQGRGQSLEGGMAHCAQPPNWSSRPSMPSAIASALTL